MKIHWVNGKYTQVVEKSMDLPSALGGKGFFATLVSGESIICLYANIMFIEL